MSKKLRSCHGCGVEMHPRRHASLCPACTDAKKEARQEHKRRMKEDFGYRLEQLREREMERHRRETRYSDLIRGNGTHPTIKVFGLPDDLRPNGQRKLVYGTCRPQSNRGLPDKQAHWFEQKRYREETLRRIKPVTGWWKWCIDCEHWHPVEWFEKNYKAKDGLSGSCKEKLEMWRIERNYEWEPTKPVGDLVSSLPRYLNQEELEELWSLRCNSHNLTPEEVIRWQELEDIDSGAIRADEQSQALMDQMNKRLDKQGAAMMKMENHLPPFDEDDDYDYEDGDDFRGF